MNTPNKFEIFMKLFNIHLLEALEIFKAFSKKRNTNDATQGTSILKKECD